MLKFNKLEDKYIISRYMYAIGNPIISDIDYDELHLYMIHNNLLEEYTTKPWQEDKIPLELLIKYNITENLNNLSFSLSRIVTSSMSSIITINDLRKLGNSKYHISRKYDGWNVQVSYIAGKLSSIETRARNDANPLKLETSISCIPKIIPNTKTVTIVGELILTNDNFVKLKKSLNKDLKSQRSSVRTAIATDNYDLLSFVAFSIWENKIHLLPEITYSLLSEWNFLISDISKVFTGYKEINNFIKTVNVVNMPVDGFVARNCETNESYALRLYEYSQKRYYSFVTGYEYSYGAHYISQNVLIFPTVTEHGTYSKISVTNLARLIDNNLLLNAPIAFDIVSNSIGILNEFSTKLLHEKYIDSWETFSNLVKMKSIIDI